MYLCILFAPFLGSSLAGLGGRFIGARGSGCVTVLGLGTSFLGSLWIWHETALMGSPVVIDLGSWFSVSSVSVQWLFLFDPLTACMMLTVTAISFCVHIYSLGYMGADPPPAGQRACMAAASPLRWSLLRAIHHEWQLNVAHLFHGMISTGHTCFRFLHAP